VQIIAGLRQAPAGQLERRVASQIVEIVGIGITAGNGEDAGAQNVGHGVSDQRRVAMVGDDRGQRVDQAQPAVGTGQEQNAAVGADLAAVERGGDFLLADTWQREWEQGIVGGGGHGRFCPGIESGVSTQSLCNSRWLHHAHQRIPAMQ
jgi:hypothetical protein